jgi:hypothetical protein
MCVGSVFVGGPPLAPMLIVRRAEPSAVDCACVLMQFVCEGFRWSQAADYACVLVQFVCGVVAVDLYYMCL